jgi:hypothetical protein
MQKWHQFLKKSPQATLKSCFNMFAHPATGRLHKPGLKRLLQQCSLQASRQRRRGGAGRGQGVQHQSMAEVERDMQRQEMEEQQQEQQLLLQKQGQQQQLQPQAPAALSLQSAEQRHQLFNSVSAELTTVGHILTDASGADPGWEYERLAEEYQVCVRCTARRMDLGGIPIVDGAIPPHCSVLPVVVHKAPVLYQANVVHACAHFRWVWCPGIEGNNKCLGSKRHEKCPK